MAEYRVTIGEEPWVDRGGYVVFAVEIERPEGAGWTAVRGSTSQLRVPTAEVRAALQAGNPLQALAALVRAYAAQDEGVIADSRIAPYREQLPEFPVTLEFEV